MNIKKSKIKIIFFGTSEFAVPALEALVKEGYDVVAVITVPDKPSGRKQTLTSSPVKLTAQKFGLKVHQFQKLEIGNWKLEIPDVDFDVGVVASYGKLIPPEIFNLPKHGTLNIHPSLLPKYRGPSPIQTAILNGDTETGVTIIKIDNQLDHGPVLANSKFPAHRTGRQIPNSKFYKELQDDLAKLGAELLLKTLPDYLAGKIKPQPQDHSQAIFTRKFTTEDGEIKSEDTIETADRKIRALNPEPGVFVWLDQKSPKIRLKILMARPIRLRSGQAIGPLQISFGNLGLSNDGQLALQLQDGYIILETVQPEGKKLMSGKDFARGYFKK